MLKGSKKEDPTKQDSHQIHRISFHRLPDVKNPVKKLLTWVNRSVISPNFTSHVSDF